MPREPPYVRTNGNSSDDQGNPETVGNIIQSNGDNSASVDTPEGSSNGMMRSSDKNLHSTDGDFEHSAWVVLPGTREAVFLVLHLFSCHCIIGNVSDSTTF